MKFVRFLALGLLVMIVLACGGGGSGTESLVGNVLYTTDWTQRASTGGGLSQRIAIYDQQNRVVRSLITNYSGTNTSELTFDGIASGTYSLRGELFSQTNLNGIKTGEFAIQFNLTSSFTYRTVVGQAVDRVVVTPTAGTTQAPGSIQFFAQVQTVDSQPTFAAPGSITWQSLGGTATIGSMGLLVGDQVGSGSVRATYTPTSRIGAATYNFSDPQTRKTKWTILVYMNAANDLYSFSTLNMNQMERVADNEEVRFVVQWKQSQAAFPSSSFDGTRRYVVTPDTTATVTSKLVQNLGNDVDMGVPETLKDFIAWGKQFYPAERYGVIIWNHGNGWRRKPAKGSITRAVSYDDQTGNAIQTWQLPEAFAGQKFDFIAWDASLMQMIEVAYEIKDHADFVIGSEESPPAAGYPYDDIFQVFKANPDASTKDLTKAFVDGMVNEPGYASERITQSVIDTSKLEPLATAINTLGDKLIRNSGSMSNLILNIRGQAQSYSDHVAPPRYYRDLVDVCLRLEAGSSVTEVVNAAAAVRTASRNAVVWEGHNSLSPGSNGISIDFTPGNIFLTSSTDYSRLKFAARTLWDDWLAIAP